MLKTTVQSVQFILVKTIKNHQLSQLVSVLCHFENAYFSLNLIIIGLTKKGTNTCRIYEVIIFQLTLSYRTQLLFERRKQSVPVIDRYQLKYISEYSQLTYLQTTHSALLHDLPRFQQQTTSLKVRRDFLYKKLLLSMQYFCSIHCYL